MRERGQILTADAAFASIIYIEFIKPVIYCWRAPAAKPLLRV